MKRVVHRRRGPRFKEWGCPRTRNRTNWCYGWCVPADGIGACGRVAPHGIMGRTQLAILHHKNRQED